MSYIDAGYAAGLSVLFLYAASLVVRRRALERRSDLRAPRRPSAPEPTESGR
jgi:hypothetical protein